MLVCLTVIYAFEAIYVYCVYIVEIAYTHTHTHTHVVCETSSMLHNFLLAMVYLHYQHQQALQVNVSCPPQESVVNYLPTPPHPTNHHHRHGIYDSSTHKRFLF